MLDPAIQVAMQSLKPSPGATEADIARMTFALKIELPAEYLDLLRYANGAEGTVGEDGKYVHLCSTSEIPTWTAYEQPKSLQSEVVVIGGDGGGEAFCIDFREGNVKPKYIMAPLVGWLPDALPAGLSLREFFEFLNLPW